MPIIEHSSYKSPFLFKNKNIQTIFPAIIRTFKNIEYTRERITTPDNDFIDLDWSIISPNSKKLIVLFHGLEGDTKSQYISGLINAFHRRNINCVAMNLRGCSGEPNKYLYSYHYGSTEDLDTLIKHLVRKYNYNNISLVGYSLGGMLVTKYLGEKGNNINNNIKSASCISVPCDLLACSLKISKSIYNNYFVKKLKNKLFLKMNYKNNEINYKLLNNIKTIYQYDDYFNSELHGYENALDLYKKNECKQFINNIKIRTLMINALDDPFMTPDCYPVEEAKKCRHFYLELPRYGGHVGFISFNKEKEYWSEKRICDFILDINNTK